MPAYNTEQYIGEAINSVLNQTFTDFELIIVNDGSTDKTEEVIKSFDDSRIVLVNQPNGGVSAALNTGLRYAKGEYIARFDADDICFPDRLQLQYTFMKENPDYVVIGSDADYMDKNGEYLYFYSNIGHTNEEITERFTTYCPFIHSSVFYRKDIAIETGGYNERAHTFEDYLLWKNFIKKGKVCNFRQPLISVRLNPESVTVDERLRGKRFIELKKAILFGNGDITEELEKELLAILKSQNFHRFKHFSYHILAAKKYLWNNHQPAKARGHLKKAISLKPFAAAAYGLLVLSYIPKTVVGNFYKLYKTARN